jgi:hypothetical protein
MQKSEWQVKYSAFCLLHSVFSYRGLMTDETVNIEGAVCTPPLPHGEQIVMGHGAGGRMSHQLMQKAFMSAFEIPPKIEQKIATLDLTARQST